MNQRGLSSIVTTVIVILISVAAVSGIWLVIKPLVDNPIKASPIICQSTTFEIKSCQKITTSAGQEGYNIAYTLANKNDQVESLSDIKVIIDLEDGSRLAGSGDSAIQVGETKDVQLITDKSVTGTSILSILNLDSERKTTCNSQEFTCENTPVITELDPQWQIPVPIDGLGFDSNLSNGTEGYPGCFGIYVLGGPSDSQGLCNGNDQQTCTLFNNWNGECQWYPEGHCVRINPSSETDCASLNQGQCETMEGTEGCYWISEPACDGPQLKCSDMNKSDACSALQGCSWVEEPSACGDEILGKDEECDSGLLWQGTYDLEGFSISEASFMDSCSNYAGTETPVYYGWNKFEDSPYNVGSVSCNSCMLDFSGCSSEPVCGNGEIEGEEQCDGNNFAHEPVCSYFNRNTGLPDDENCPTYPNGTINWGNCYAEGDIYCTPSCIYDFTHCNYCDHPNC